MSGNDDDDNSNHPFFVRTPKHQLTILTKSIEILKTDVSKAEALRLKALRLKSEKKTEWELLLSELDTFKEEVSDQMMICEFLTEDVQEILQDIHDRERSSRLSCASDERIAKLEKSLENKMADLTLVIERESITKKELEEFMTNYNQNQHLLEARQRDFKENIKRLLTNDGGAGDISDHSDCEPSMLCENLQKISTAYEDIRNQREILEQEVTFIRSKLKEIKMKVEEIRSELRLMTTELKLKERQRSEAEEKNSKNLQLVQEKEDNCKRIAEEFYEAQVSTTEAEEVVRTIKKLIKSKLAERQKLEETVKRQDEILGLKVFSRSVTLNVPVHKNYAGLELEVVKYLNRLINTTSFGHPKELLPDWTNDIENLDITFTDSVDNLHDDMTDSLPVTPTMMIMESKEKIQPSKHTFNKIVPRFKRRSLSNTNSVRLQHGYQYQPPLPVPVVSFTKHSKPVNSTELIDEGGLNKYIRGKNRVSPSMTPLPLLVREHNLKLGRSQSVGIVRKTLDKFNTLLASGIDRYPKTLVVKGVMYRLSDRFSNPVVLSGPLTLKVWERHEADNKKPIRFSENKFSQLFNKFLFGNTQIPLK